MVTRLPTCGNCRRENNELQRKIVLETDGEVELDEDPFSMGEGTIPTTVERELIEYRRDRRYYENHRTVKWARIFVSLPRPLSSTAPSTFIDGFQEFSPCVYTAVCAV